ncbi:MAG: hypothetical protein Fur0016_10010 [Anaerolineales bacterium]
MDKKSAALLIAIIAILVSSACVLTIPVPGAVPVTLPVDTTTELSQPDQQQPQDVNPTFTLVFTDTPAPTLTLAFTPTFFPTITPFPTASLTPSITPTLVPVEIATLGVDLPQETLTQIALTPLSSGDPPGAEYACLVTARRVADFTVFKPKAQFTAWWDMRNVGQKKWAEGIVVISLVEGPRLTTDRFFPLPSEPKPWEQIRLRLEMTAPAQEGTYLMTWGLKNTRSNRHFCFFTINIVVKK